MGVRFFVGCRFVLESVSASVWVGSGVFGVRRYGFVLDLRCLPSRQTDELRAWRERLRTGRTGAKWLMVQRAWDETPVVVRFQQDLPSEIANIIS
jgi:hypothetical protein